MLTQKFATGLFDEPYRGPGANLEVLDSPAHRQLALEAAEQGIVLLTNHNATLPLQLRGKKVALFGPFASSEAKEDPAYEALIGSPNDPNDPNDPYDTDHLMTL